MRLILAFHHYTMKSTFITLLLSAALAFSSLPTFANNPSTNNTQEDSTPTITAVKGFSNEYITLDNAKTIIKNFLRTSPDYRNIRTAIELVSQNGRKLNNINVQFVNDVKGNDIMSTNVEKTCSYRVNIKNDYGDFIEKITEDGLLNTSKEEEKKKLIMGQLGATLIHEICGHVYLLDQFQWKNPTKGFEKLTQEAFANYVEYLYRRDVLNEKWNNGNTLFHYLNYAPLSEISHEYRAYILFFCKEGETAQDYQFEINWEKIKNLLQNTTLSEAEKLKEYSGMICVNPVRDINIYTFLLQVEKKSANMDSKKMKRHIMSLSAAYDPNVIVKDILMLQLLSDIYTEEKEAEIQQTIDKYKKQHKNY